MELLPLAEFTYNNACWGTAVLGTLTMPSLSHLYMPLSLYALVKLFKQCYVYLLSLLAFLLVFGYQWDSLLYYIFAKKP